MPRARSRYDVVLIDSRGQAPRPVPVVVDMLELRDRDPQGRPGRLRWAEMLRYDAPHGELVCYGPLWIDRQLRFCLSLNDVPQRGVEWDRRWLRWEDAEPGWVEPP